MGGRLWLGAALAPSIATSITLVGQAPVDNIGRWLFAVETSAGSGMPTVTLKQDGEKLTGHYSSQQLGEADLTGTVKGHAVSFAFGADVQGTHIDVTIQARSMAKTS